MKRKWLIAFAFVLAGLGTAGGYYYYFSDVSRGGAQVTSIEGDGPGCGSSRAPCDEATVSNTAAAKSGDDGGGCGGNQADCGYETP